MYIESYKWLAGKLPIDRTKFMTGEYSKLIKDYAESISGNNVALLYAGGPVIHHSDSRNFEGMQSESIVIKTQLGFNIINVAKLFTNVDIEYISVNANTCASSMHCLYEAKLLFEQGYEKVIIVAMEMTEPYQLKLFEQLGIDIVCSDGLAVIVLNNSSGIAKIDSVSWKWNKDRSPMTVSEEGYTKVLNTLDLGNVVLVKPHGTGTDRNTIAESSALDKFNLGLLPRKMYKNSIGHTQGASTAVEICMLLDEIEVNQKTLVLASGMGGYYGGCTLWKCQ